MHSVHVHVCCDYHMYLLCWWNHTEFICCCLLLFIICIITMYAYVAMKSCMVELISNQPSTTNTPYVYVSVYFCVPI